MKFLVKTAIAGCYCGAFGAALPSKAARPSPNVIKIRIGRLPFNALIPTLPDELSTDEDAGLYYRRQARVPRSPIGSRYVRLYPLAVSWS